MNKIIVIIISMLFIPGLKAQVGIGTNTPNNSSALEIYDTTRGLLIPRMSMVNRLSILSPATGLMIYQTDSTKGFWFYDGNRWVSISTNLTDSVNSSGHVTISATKNGSLIVVYTTTNAYGFTKYSTGNPAWFVQSISGSVLRAIATDSAIVLCTSTQAYGFMMNGSGNPNWYVQSLTGTPLGIASSGNIVVVYTSLNAYGLMKTSGNPAWWAQSLTGTPLGIVGRDANGDECVVVYTSSNAYGFIRSGAGFPQWLGQSLSGTPLGGTSSGNYIVIYTSSNAYGFTRAGTGVAVWTAQSLSGTPVGILPN